MVGVVVDDPHPGGLAAQLEPAFDPGEGLEAVADRRSPQPELEPDGGGGQAVQDRGAARLLQVDGAGQAAPDAQLVAGPVLGDGDPFGRNLGIGREPVGDDPAADARQQRAHVLAVDADDRSPVERSHVDETQEGVEEVVHPFVGVEMLAVDSGDHRQHRQQPQEGAVGFVGLRHQDFGLPDARSAPDRCDPAPDHRRRIEARVIEQHRGHRSRRGLAVRPRYRHRKLHPHQLGEHFRARNDGELPLPGRRHFGVAGRNRR